MNLEPLFYICNAIVFLILVVPMASLLISGTGIRSFFIKAIIPVILVMSNVWEFIVGIYSCIKDINKEDQKIRLGG